MPMIEAKVTMELPAEKRDVLKARKYGMNAKNRIVHLFALPQSVIWTGIMNYLPMVSEF